MRDKPLPVIHSASGTGQADEEFDVDTFSRRYPSLSGLEMVEREIPGSATGRGRGREREV
jgi:AP2-associated kinase